MAGIAPTDVDVAEIYDCFTYVVLLQLEALGFCATRARPARSCATAASRSTARSRTNTHGGLLSQGHMWGMNHVVEAVRQVRGEPRRSRCPTSSSRSSPVGATSATAASRSSGVDR